MKSGKKLTALILAVAMVVSNMNTTMTGAATAKATTLRLEQTEGTATLKNANGTAKTIKAGMKLYNGDDLSTSKSSYAYISLDSTKAVKLDESSSVTIKQSGTENEVFVNSGSLMFNVTVPLAKKESLNIRTSTMVTGVRGTIGYAQIISEEESEIYILEGKVELTSIDSKTGYDKTVAIQAGEKGVCRLVDAKFDKQNDIQVPEVTPVKFTEEDIKDYVIIEIGRNLDIQNRLRKDGVLDVDKILDIYRKLSDTGTYITIGTPVTPNSVSTNRPAVTANTAEKESNGGGGGGGGASGGSGGGTANNSAEQAAPVITLATVSGGGVYSQGDPIGALSVDATVDKADAYTTYQWYVANSAGGEGTAVTGATDVAYTPDSVLGTRYFYCVVKTKASSASTKASTRETNRVMVAVKQATNLKAQFPENYTPIDTNIGFTSITLDEIALQSVGSVNGSINETGSKITLTGLDHSSRVSSMTSQYNATLGSVRADKNVFNDPGDTVSTNVVEYAKSTTDTAPESDDEWQTDRTFTGLLPNTLYYFYARAAATDSTFAGEPSVAISVRTRALDSVTSNSVPDDHLTYSFDLTNYDGTVSPNAIVKGISAEGTDLHDIIIPESIRAYDIDIKVTEIAFGAFNEHGGVNIYVGSVVIPNTITKIGEEAFYGKDIKTLTIPDSVKEIGKSAFNSCTDLEKVVIGDGVETIGDSAFSGDRSITSITTGKNIRKIGKSAFNGCSGIESIIFSDTVETIGEAAFRDCEDLKSFRFGDRITVVPNSIFDGCSNLESVEFGKNITEIGDYAFISCTNLNNVIIPEKTEKIGRQAFQACSSLENVIFNDGIKNIGYYAFYACNNLKEAIIPSSVETVSGNGNGPFFGSGVTTVYCELSSKPSGWEEGWNLNTDGNFFNITTFWYEEDPEDPSVVRLYSPDAYVIRTLSGIPQNQVHATQLDFPYNASGSSFNEYYDYIDSAYISKMFERYDTVIIPEENISILNADLTIPADKTLDIRGDMATENFMLGGPGYKKYSATNIPRGSLTNNGTILVKGNLITANEESVILDANAPDFSEKWSSTVNSSGDIVVSGKMSVFFTHHDEASLNGLNIYYSNYNGINCQELTVVSTGNLEIYGLYGATNANHNAYYNAGTIGGLTASDYSNENYMTLSKSDGVDRSDSFKLVFDIDSGNYRLRVLDSTENKFGILYSDPNL